MNNSLRARPVAPLIGRQASYELQHKVPGNPGWYKSRNLGEIRPREAKEELDRARALAKANATGAQYRLVKTTREVLEW